MTGVDAELAARLVVLALGRVGPARSRWLLEGNTAVEVIAALGRRALPVSAARAPKGVTTVLVERWFSEVRLLDGAELLHRHRAAGQIVLGPDDQCWPFVDDPEPPIVLFARGHLDALDHRPRVAVVGTRRCTTVGRRVADGFGAELTEGGVSVVSGLALGIDGAAHLGALAVPAGPRPIGVVATGLDRVYPASHGGLWAELAERGLLLSEAPLGTSPERWRFPARNRLIAGLSDVVVVVESHERGGALLTVDEAAARGVPVAVVPGSVTSPASSGTNDLLFDGCLPVRTSGDVLELLGFSESSSLSPTKHREHRAVPPIGRPTLQRLALDGAGPERAKRAAEALGIDTNLAGRLSDLVLAELETGAVHVDTLVAVTERSVAEILQLLNVLQGRGEVVFTGGWVARP